MTILSKPRKALARQVEEAVRIAEEEEMNIMNSKSMFGTNRIPRITIAMGDKTRTKRKDKEEEMQEKKKMKKEEEDSRSMRGGECVWQTAQSEDSDDGPDGPGPHLGPHPGHTTGAAANSGIETRPSGSHHGGTHALSHEQVSQISAKNIANGSTSKEETGEESLDWMDSLTNADWLAMDAGTAANSGNGVSRSGLQCGGTQVIGMRQVSQSSEEERKAKEEYHLGTSNVERGERSPGGAGRVTGILKEKSRERDREVMEAVMHRINQEEEEEAENREKEQTDLENLRQEAKEERHREEERKEESRTWEQEGWGNWEYREQGWHEIHGEWKIVFTTHMGRREWMEEDRRRTSLEEGRTVVATPKRKREEEEWRAGIGGASVETPEKKRCLGRRGGEGSSPELLRTLVDRSRPHTEAGSEQRGEKEKESCPVTPAPRKGDNYRNQEEERVRHGARGGKQGEEGRDMQTGGATQPEGTREVREPGRGPEGDVQEEEKDVPGGALEHPSPAPPVRLKPPSSKQKPRRKRQPRKPRFPKDLTQRTIIIARRRRTGREEGRIGGDDGGAEDSEEGEWTWGTQEAEG